MACTTTRHGNDSSSATISDRQAAAGRSGQATLGTKAYSDNDLGSGYSVTFNNSSQTRESWGPNGRTGTTAYDNTQFSNPGGVYSQHNVGTNSFSLTAIPSVSSVESAFTILSPHGTPFSQPTDANIDPPTLAAAIQVPAVFGVAPDESDALEAQGNVGFPGDPTASAAENSLDTAVANLKASTNSQLLQACFAAGTLVLMAEGPPKPIEIIRSGDVVKCKRDGDPSGSLLERTVEAVYHHPPNELVTIEVDDLLIRTTPNHIVWEERSRQWTMAAKLRPGDQLRGHDNLIHTVTSVIADGQVEPVYNIAVAECHTYFVTTPNGDTSVLVL